MEPENTPTPHDITSAEKATADVVYQIRETCVVMEDGECAQQYVLSFDEAQKAVAALIESQRATIERVERESIIAPAECGPNCDDPECPYSHHPLTLRQAYENAVSRLRAAEARVTALVRDLTSVKQQCETAIYNISQREHDAAVVRSFQNIAYFCDQALSRSSTEAGDGA